MAHCLRIFVVAPFDYAEIASRALEAEQCALVVIDIQEKLLPPIFQKEQLVRNAQLSDSRCEDFEHSGAGEHAVREGTGRDGAGDRFPAPRDRGD